MNAISWQLLAIVCILLIRMERQPTLPPHADAPLVLQLKNGDMNAAGVLYSRYRTPVYGFCFRMLREEAPALDAAQETFLKMIANIGGLQSGVMFRAWLFTIARNEVLMMLRKRKTAAEDPLDDAATVADPGTPLRSAEGSESSVLIVAALDRLRPIYREAFLLREQEGLSYEEITVVTAASLSAVKSRIFKARMALASILSSHFDTGAL